MSRIEEALKRVTGAVADLRPAAGLDLFSAEKSPKTEPAKPRSEQTKVSTFTAAEPQIVRHQVVAAVVADPPVEPENPQPAEGVEAGNQAEVEKLIDFRQIANYAGFLFRSLGRHKRLAALTVALVLAMTVAAARLMPKTYHVGTKLLAQRNAVMAALSNPGRAVPWDADAPTRAAAETVLKRDNLIALIKQTDLMDEWQRTRAPILRLKDVVMRLVTGHTPTAEEKLEAMIGLLEARIIVIAGPVGDGTVTIDLDWPDPQSAFHLVEGAQKAFLEARQQAETAAIGESISILERYSTSLHDDIDRTLSQLQKTQARRTASAASARLATTSRTRISAVDALPSVGASLGVPQLDVTLDSNPETKRLKAIIADKKQELARIDETRQRQLTELQGRLTQLTTVYTASHPSVLSVQQNISALSREAPQAVALRAEVDELQVEYDRRMAAAADAQIKAELERHAGAGRESPATTTAARDAAAPPPAPAPAEPAANTDISEFSTLRLRSELNQLESVLERTDGARIELAVSQAAFKYRYSVIRPAQIPTFPVRPDIRVVIAAGVLGSLLMALVAVVGRDLLGERILEPWQVERQLGLPILGSLGTA